MANVNPWIFIFKLIGAIICLIITPILLVQMYIFIIFIDCYVS